MTKTLTLHGLIGCSETSKVFLTALHLGIPMQFSWMSESSTEYKRVNPTGCGASLETPYGFLTGSAGMLRYLCNLDSKNAFAGRTLFEQATCDSWLAYVTEEVSVSAGLNGSQGLATMTDKERTDFYGSFPKALVPVEQHFKTNTYFCGDHMTIADMALVGAMFGGGRGSMLPDAVMKKMPNLSKWYNNMVSKDCFKRAFGNTFGMKVDFALPDQAAVAKRVGGACNKKAGKAADKKAGKPAGKKGGKEGAKVAAPAKPADDDFDLFGDETEEDKEAAEALKKKADAPAKKEKKVIIAKSMVIFDIKGYEVEADWEALATKCRAIEMDGLTWMDIHKVLPVAFGMKKLQMSMLIEDEKIQTEDVFEIIESWEDDVQSTDIFSFNKA